MGLLAKAEELVGKLEQSEAVDPAVDRAVSFLERVLPGGKVGDVLTGTVIGHPLHPLLVAIPIGSWTAASYLDLTGGSGRAAKRLIGLGCAAALPTALSGAVDWTTTAGAERRVGGAHAALNDVALMLYTGSWLARRSGRRGRGIVLALAGATAMGCAGWLGGHLVYGLGVGVDTTAFQQLPEEWTDAGPAGGLSDDAPVMREVGGIPVMLARSNGTVHAIADRCTHRGGPLHEGRFDGRCVTCPWHESAFDVSDGSVVSGPATRPQPVAEVRIVDDRVQVRRREARTMRTNPIGI